MAIEEQLQETPEVEEQESSGGNMTDDQERDLELAVLFGKNVLADAEEQIIAPALKSKDPGQVLGQFFLTLIKKIDESFVNDMALDKAIYLAEGGWLEQMSEELQDEYGVSEDITNRMETYVASMAQQMAQQGQQQEAQAPAAVPPGAPVMPTGVQTNG